MYIIDYKYLGYMIDYKYILRYHVPEGEGLALVGAALGQL